MVKRRYIATSRFICMGAKQLLLSGAVLAPLWGASAFAIEIRSIDGSGNNIADPTFGEAGTELLRLVTPAYDDGLSVPRGGDPSALPSARAISNTVSTQSVSVPSAAGVSNWIWQWGQFLDHDIDLTEGASPAEPFNISVPTGDPLFDPGSTGTKEIDLDRSLYTVDSFGVRQQVNEITAYIDASNVYGSDSGRADDLRSFDGMGSLRISVADNGEILLPFNTSGLDNAMPGGAPAEMFFIAGDVRANEQVGLAATHTLFVREHNRLAADMKTKLDGGDPLLSMLRDSAITELGNGVDDEGDFIYESARKVVGAQIQSITYNEFLPILLGTDALDIYTGYDSGVNAGISNAFSTAAYRVGHTMLPPELLRSDDLSGATTTAIALKDAFFNPAELVTGGADSLLLGLAVGAAQEVDTLIVDDVRNFLFGPPGAGGFDLASLNIQRGRDHGLPSYNATRSELGLLPAMSFLDIAGGDVALAGLLEAVYGSVGDVDLWIGGLAENHVNGGLVGETFAHILADQFERLRDGDRFFFDQAEHLEELLAFDPLFMDHTSLGHIIERNTDYRGVAENMFLLGRVPEPNTIFLFGLGLVGLFGLGKRNQRFSADVGSGRMN